MRQVSIDPTSVLWSAPERERAGRPLLVLLHGYGSHEGDLFGLSPRLPLEPVIAAVRAPFREGPGFAWFPRGDDGDKQERYDNANAATVALLDWLESTASTSVGFLGFSQGGAMALQVLRHAPTLPSYVVQLSGFVLDDEQPGDATLTNSRPPVFWGRGTADQVISPSFIEHTNAWLPRHSMLTERIYVGLPHSVSPAELSDVNGFLRDQLG